MTLKKCYALENDGRAYRIDSINNRAVRNGASILVGKVVRKNHLVQCNFGVIACAKLCVQGVQMNWSLFLMNLLAKDALTAQACE